MLFLRPARLFELHPFYGTESQYNGGQKQEREFATMIIKFLEDLLHWNEEEEVLDAEYAPFRDQLSLAGLSEEELRKMDPDDRVAALEQANLDPYDFIYLAC